MKLSRMRIHRRSRSTVHRLCVALFLLAAAVLAQAQGADTFSNPVLDTGPDPWVIAWKGFYYYMNTTGANLTVWKTRDLSELRHAEKKIVWTPEPGQPWSHDIWAPELHRWGNKWYIYFAADAGKNDTHRIYVVENPSDDPLEGQWTLKGKVSDTTDRWAIDVDLFELRGEHYMLWSGWRGTENGEQDIFIAHMSNPWTIDSPRTLISYPLYIWEQQGDLPQRHINVNEGPEALIHGDKVFVVYSGSACWTDFYALGVIEASSNSNLLDPASWKKFDQPFFHENPKAGVFGPGHNGFFKSLDGKQDWIIYHANSASGQGCGKTRSPRMQPFTWNPDGTPNFGTPVPAGQPLAKPSHSGLH
jgi:GH43 family beta-xylosidase